MMDQLSDEELDEIFRDIKQIIDVRGQPAQKAASESAGADVLTTGDDKADSTVDKDETHPTKPT